MVQPLLATKLFIPPVRARRVQRERLLAKLDRLLSPNASLGLISAPAGFGKTSLLAEWIERVGRGTDGKRAAWLSLDAADNQAETFAAYLCAALNRACPGLGNETAALQRSQPPAALDDLLLALVNELVAKTSPEDVLIIALDDAQVITSPETRGCLSFLVEHLPSGTRLVIASRADPALPLARMRASGRMVELRAADLRFTAQEAVDFLQQSLGGVSPVSAETAAALTERTEGWAAGLQMAALALQAAPESDPAQFAHSFSGSHRFILDYLAEEVLSRLPEETVQFLLHTSILERFCAELCQAVLPGGEGTNAPPGSVQKVIESLERANLFLIPLDAERKWFRYHHLFADLLQARMKLVSPGAPARLHRRAADWFEQQGLVGEAIQHAIAAGPAVFDTVSGFEQAARLVETHTLALFIRGELDGLQRWLRLLPEDLADSRPWLCIQKAWMYAFAGRLSEIDPLLRKAEANLSGLPAEERTTLEGHCAAIHCFLLVFTHDGSPIFRQIKEVEARLPAGNWARAVAGWGVGYVLREQGELQQAAQLFEQLVDDRLRANDPWGVAMMSTDLGLVRRQQGQLTEALRVFRQGLECIEQRGARGMGYTGRLLTAMAAALYDRNQLDAAHACLDEAITLTVRWRNPNHTLYATINKARLLAARGDRQAALRASESAAGMLRDLPVTATLTQSVEALQQTLALAGGQIPTDGGPAGINEPYSDPSPAAPAYSEVLESKHLLQTRVLVVQQRWPEAIRLLDGLEASTRRLGRVLVLIDVLTLKAIALHGQSENKGARAEEAASALEEALKLAAPEDALRPILDAAVAQENKLRLLLNAFKRRLIKQGSSAGKTKLEFIDRLLAAIPQSSGAHSAASATTPSTAFEIVEPLSTREVEVLNLLAEGLTNAQIAERLVISKGTVKAHTANIFRKLDAENRTQAVAIGRGAGLI